MKPSQLAVLLTEAFAALRSVLVVGPPGVGKTDIVQQAAQAVGADLIQSHPAVEDPTVPAGLPWPDGDKKTATFLPFGNLAQALAAKQLTVWDLEDMGQASPAVQASYMQLLLAKRINNHVLPDCVTFVATTNRRIDRANVAGILEPVKSRFLTIVTLEPDLNDWCQWAFTHNIDPRVIAFLRFRPELLCAFEPTADMTNSPVPRTWANASNVLDLKLPVAIEAETLEGAIGKSAQTELSGFLRMYAQLPNIDAILINPDGQDIPSSANVLYAVVTGLSVKGNEQNFPRIARYAERLAEAAHGEMATLLIKDVERRVPEVHNTPEFAKLMSGPVGELVSGAVS